MVSRENFFLMSYFVGDCENVTIDTQNIHIKFWDNFTKIVSALANFLFMKPLAELAMRLIS